MKKIHIIILAVLCTISLNLTAQIKSANVTIGSGTTQMDMTITVNTNTSIVDFSITGPSSRWFGIGFSASSMGTNAYTILSNIALGNPTEYNQVYHALPALQTSQNLSNISSTTNGGFKTYTFSRAMNTADANDFVFTSSTASINLIWAYGASTTLAQHAQRGTANITLVDMCNIPNTNLPAVSICMGDSTIIFGNYENQAGNYVDTITTSNGCDSVIIQNLIVEQAFTQQLTDTVLCYGDSLLIFGNWITDSGIYYDSLQSVNGCDSIYYINVNKIQIDTTVYASATQLNAAYAFAHAYQWYDCATSMAIAGANLMSFMPTQNGSYKVKITSFTCIETSFCHNVNWFVGIDNSSTSNIKISPNPVSNQLLIELPEGKFNYKLIIYSSNGQQIKELVLNSMYNSIDLSSLSAGVYIYQIYDNTKMIKASRFIKD